jgi:methylase of polypeptide subunit release factors
VKSFAEIGCGSGFLTKFGLEYAREVTRASATDINLEAVRCTSDNLAEHPKRQMLNLVLPDANSADLGLDGQYDLVFSNPPYIPRPEAKRDNPYEGLELVAHLARQAKSILHESGRILINLSSLAGDAPLEWFAAQGLQVKALETMRVPLKVYPVTSGLSAASRAWRDYLEVQGRVEVDASEASGYRYWHQLRMFKIER